MWPIGQISSIITGAEVLLIVQVHHRAGAGNFGGIFTPFYTINFRGWLKSGSARATAASASLAPFHTIH